MKRLAVLAAAAALTAATSGPAASPVTGLSRLHTAPGDAAMVGQERIVRPGEVLLSTTLIQPDIAILAMPVASKVHGLDPRLPMLAGLRRATLSMPSHLGTTLEALTYCSASRRLSDDERRTGPEEISKSGRRLRIVHFEAEAQFCLIDDTADGTFDRAFIIGARTPAFRETVPITPVVYAQALKTKIPDAYLRLEYSGTGSIFGPVIRYKSNIDGQDKEAALFVADETGKLQLVDARKGIRGDKFPKVLDLGPVQITLLGRDPADNAITYRIDRTFAYREVNINVSSGSYNTTYY